MNYLSQTKNELRGCFLISDKRILLRVDYNVPIKNKIIQDDSRIIESIPTIHHIL